MVLRSQANTSLYRFLIVIILFCLIYWVLAEKVLGFYGDVEKLSEQKSRDDFVTSVSHIRQQWMRFKKPRFEIKLVASNLASDGQISVAVNQQGFVTQVLSSNEVQCLGLYKNLQSMALKEVKVVEIIDNNQVVGCKYYKNTKLLFKYMFLNGIVGNS